MTDIDLQLTRRRVLAGILIIGLAAAAAGVGTFALFSDEETSESNINAGDLELDSVSGDLSADNLYPTESTGVQTISTEYTAGVPADLTLEVSTNNSDFAGQLDVESVTLFVGGDQEQTISDAGTLDSLTGTHDNIATLSGGESVTVDANFTLGADTSNDYQGDSVDITVTFNATQQT